MDSTMYDDDDMGLELDDLEEGNKSAMLRTPSKKKGPPRPLSQLPSSQKLSTTQLPPATPNKPQPPPSPATSSTPTHLPSPSLSASSNTLSPNIVSKSRPTTSTPQKPTTPYTKKAPPALLRPLPSSPAAAFTSSPNLLTSSSSRKFSLDASPPLSARDSSVSVDSVNSYQEHIQRLEQSNNLLLKQVANKDKQIEFMAQEDLSSLSKEISQLPESALKNRLLALARKNKTLTVAYEKEKTKNTKLTSDMQALQAKLNALTEAQQLSPNNTSYSLVHSASNASLSQGSSSENIQELRDNNTKLRGQLLEHRDKSVSLQNEVKSLRRLLTRELGENVDIDKIMNDRDATWKGRAQQISILKTKIKELSGDTLKSTSPIEEAHREQINNKIAERHKSAEKTTQDLETTRQELKQAKFKIDALSSRERILEAEMASLKEKMKVVLEKTSNDDRLILLLKKEVLKLKEKPNE